MEENDWKKEKAKIYEANHTGHECRTCQEFEIKQKKKI